MSRSVDVARAAPDAEEAPSRRVRPARTNDPERTRAQILKAAADEFAEYGLDGARIDAIAAATATSKRMIYYYFGSKEGLYIAVLEAAYAAVRAKEAELHLDALDPVTALRRLVEFTFDHHQSHEPYIRLVMNENIQRGRYLAQSRTIRSMNVRVIEAIADIYARGVAAGVFRPGLDPIDLHASISALSFFNVSNRHTFAGIFKRDFAKPAVARRRRASVVEMIERFVRA
jgi:AcrR family transcriptional regulator